MLDGEEKPVLGLLDFKVKNMKLILEVLLIFIYAEVNYCDNGAQDGTLKLVQVVFRHGDRNPVVTYPLYPYRDESYWPEGYGQLTKKGKIQHFQLGQYLRRRYAEFLDASYSPNEIFVMSSNADRAIMSAEANLAGLYPPNDETSRWNPTINWQLIPVHTLPEKYDKLLQMSAACPKFKQLRKELLMHSPEGKSLRQKYSEVFDLLANRTGKMVVTADDVTMIYDALFVAYVHYGTWPDWAPEGSSTLEALRNIKKFSFQTLAYTLEMQRLRGGPLVQELLRNFNAKSSSEMDKRRKFFMYSGHDTTLVALMSTIGVYDPQQVPTYASVLIFELWEQADEYNSIYIVKIFYKNETNSEPYLLSVPGCPNPCSLLNLNKVLKQKITQDWDKECETVGLLGLFLSNFIVMITGSVAIVIFVGVAISSLVAMMKNNRHFGKAAQYRYLHLQQD